MAQPPTYARQYNFTDFSSAQPNAQQPGVQLDAEYNAIRTTLLATLVNLALIQRDDGAIANSSVHLEALSSSVRTLIAATGGTVRGAWVTATDYAVKDIVTEDSATYICVTAHTSGTFSTDLAAVKWIIIGSSSGAGDIAFTPASNIAATTVQAAIEEVNAERQPLDATLTAFAALSIVADRLPYGSGNDAFSLATFTAAGRALLDDADASAQLTTLGLSAFVKTLMDDADAAAFLTTLGVSAFVQTIFDDADAATVRTTLGISATTPRGYIDGLIMANGTDATNDIDIGAGSCCSDDGTADITVSAITKRLDATWVVGTGNGGLDTGSLSSAAWVYAYAIKSAGGVTDVLFTQTFGSPTMPGGYSLKRYIGAVYWGGSALRGFYQHGDRFNWKAAVEDVDVSNLSTARTLYTLSVPTGMRVRALARVTVDHASGPGRNVVLQTPDETDAAPSPTAVPGVTIATQSSSGDENAQAIELMTDTSARIGARSSEANTLLRIHTYGYVDARGKN